MRKLFETEYIETPSQQYYGGKDVVVYPWLLVLVIAGLLLALVYLK